MKRQRDDGQAASGAGSLAGSSNSNSNSNTDPSNKQRKVGTKPLDGFFGVGPARRPKVLGVSDPLRDKDSLFIAFATTAESTNDIEKLRDWVSEVGNAEYGDNAAPASHIMHAARLLTVKTGKTGKYVSDFDVRLHTEDDGESRGGKAVGEALAAADAADVVVAVSRWFGGSMLGPRRFDDIKEVTTEALYRLRDEEEIQTLRASLVERDAEIDRLLTQVARLEGTLSTVLTAQASTPTQDYSSLDLAKAKRLHRARELRVVNLKEKLAKVEKEAADDLPDLPASSATTSEV
ncbi:hypothetical protein EMMF5_005524 [Cystobasidiomycetes sp. EMM_F5]